MASSNLVGYWTDRSAGFSPLRIRPRDVQFGTIAQCVGNPGAAPKW
jgi:hypothetical protein